MLRFTKRTDYGLIALKHLASREAGSSASAKEIAGRYRIPVPLMSKVLQALARSGFLISEHGTHGGYRLARDPRLISALEVIRAIDGPIVLTSCFSERGDCDQSECCNVREPLKKIHDGILSLLESITITDLTSEASGKDSGGREWETAARRFPQVESGLRALR